MKPIAVAEQDSVAGFMFRTLLSILTMEAEVAELQESIRALTRSMATAVGIPASYPPMG
jgi:hypothetical protein